LFLTLACFLGIIAIFIFDGYIGVYDKLLIDNGQFKQTVEADQWAQNEKFGGITSTGVDRTGRADFTYTVENHRFSEYSADIEITLWYNREKTATLFTGKVTAPPFDTSVTEFFIDAGVIPAGFSPELSYNVNLIIKNGDFERNVLINFFPSSNLKNIPIPAPPR
jgi:hypothetical protein